MNIRKPTDYTAMFTTLDAAVAAQLPQMELYREIGRVVSGRSEKGAAVAASEYLQATYPTAEGFSPRNLRRMREFYAAYEESPEIIRLAMHLGWTQNVAILERCSSNDERAWYIRAVLRFGWKKAKLLDAIESQAWLYSSLDAQTVSCYTEEKEISQECESDEKDTLCVSRQYLPQPHGRVRDEGLGQKSWACFTVPYRIGGYQPGGDRQSGLSSGTAQAGGTWDILRRSHSTAAHQCRLREMRSLDRDGQSQPSGYVPHLRRRFCWQAAPPDGLHRPPPRCCRPVVHRRFRGNLAGCAGGMSRTAEKFLIISEGGCKVAITEKAIGVIADIGIDVAKEHFKNKCLEAKAKEKLSEYLTQQKKYNFDCSLEEEIDFEGLAEYIHNDLMDDVKIRLFGKKSARGVARETIAGKAADYAQAKTKLSRDRAKHLAVTAVDILSGFFRSKIDYSTLFVATEIEDTIIDEMSEQHKEQEHKIEALAKNIQDNSLLSIDKNVSLANAGKLGDVEKNTAAFFAGLGTAHVLTPYYGFTMDGVSCLKSIPLRPDAVELYPPHFEVTATAFKMGGRLLPNVDASTFTRAYRTQSPIEFDVTTAQKYLGSIPDPVQHEAEKLTGTHMVLKPPTFPPAFPCSVLIDGETVIDYLLLRTKRIEEDGTIIITNEEQKNFNFTVTLTVNTAVTSLNLSVTPSNPSNIESLKYRYFLKRAISAHRIDLKSLEHNIVFISSKANLMPHNCENLDAEIEFLEKVVAIEKQFHIKLTIPGEIDVRDHRIIDRLYSMIEDGKCCGTCSRFTMSFELSQELRNSICDLGDRASELTYVMDIEDNLFDQKLCFRIIRRIDCLRLEDFKKVKAKLDVLDDGDILKISFISGMDNSDAHYSDRFYSEEVEKQLSQSSVSKLGNEARCEQDAEK